MAACIIRWPRTTRSPWVSYSLRAEVGLEHRGLRLLGLQDERVLAVAADEQDHPGPGADAADADHLAGHVGNR